MKHTILPALLSIALFSCGKDGAEDTEAPVITIISPANSQVVSAGEIHVKGTVSDNAYISQVHVEIYESNGTEVTHVHIHPATKSYALDQVFTASAGKSYKIKVIAEDPSTNSTIKQVEITCN